MITQSQYDQLLKLANKLRGHYWDKRKGSKSAIEKEHRTGLEMDKLLREMNKQVLSNQIKIKL